MHKLITIQCSYCEKSFEKSKSETVRQNKKGKHNFFCSKACLSLSRSLKAKYNNVIANCKHCDKEFITKSGGKDNKKCCSESCSRLAGGKTWSKIAKQRAKSPEEKQLQAKINRINYYKNKKTITTCEICCQNFLGFKRKTCSKKCYSLLISKNARSNINCGGQTNYKKFKHNDIWMDSSWEVELAQWLDDNSIEWVRSKKYNFKWVDTQGKERTYFPDFYLPEYNIYLDPKNKYLLSRDKFKLEYVQNKYNIILIYGLLEDVKNKVSAILNS